MHKLIWPGCVQYNMAPDGKELPELLKHSCSSGQEA